MTAHYHCLTGGLELPIVKRFSSHVKSNRVHFLKVTDRESASTHLLFSSSVCGVLSIQTGLFSSVIQKAQITDTDAVSSFKYEATFLYVLSVESCFHSSCLVEETRTVKVSVHFLDKLNKDRTVNAHNSPRPVRVGVDGSISGAAPNVTVFAGVRASSLAMNERQNK